MAHSVGRDPFARGEYERRCIAQFRFKCAWCGQHRKRLYTYVWVPDDKAHHNTDSAHCNAKPFCNFECFQSYYA